MADAFFPDDPEDEPALQVVIEHPSRSLDTERLEARLRRAAEAEGAAIRYLAVILTDHDAVQALHRDFFDDDTRTDVVTFPLADEPGVVDGEVYVDLDTAAERAPEFDASFEAEATRYAIHGLLHLLGYDDASDEARAAMRRLEDRYLAL